VVVGQQFHQYQQNEPHSKSLNTKKIMTYANGNPGLGLGQAQKCGGIKLVNGITTPNTHPILPSS
jgi:hypothetical protein